MCWFDIDETYSREQEELDIPNCKECKHCFNLSVHTLHRSEELYEVLKKNNITNVCLGFGLEGVAEIGNFQGCGCELFEKKA